MTITAVILDPFFFPAYPYHIELQAYCIKFKVHSRKYVVLQNMITAVLLWNHFSPTRLVPVQKCIQFIDTYCIAKFVFAHSYL